MTDTREIFQQTNLKGIVTRLDDAQTALNISINGKYQVIHPGAIIVFCHILDEILRETNNLLKECESADLDLCCKEEKIKAVAEI